MRLQGSKALITGASLGLGREIARAFIAEGASVMICGRRKRELDAARKDIIGRARPGQRVLAITADVSSESDMDRLVRRALKEFPDLGILVNNAGIYGPKGGLEKANWNEWKHAQRVNLLGPAYLCRKLIPHFKKVGLGKIINLSGGGATAPLPFLSAYAASKAALVRLTETLAGELPAGISANSIAPGPLNTRLLDEILAAGPKRVGEDFYKKSVKQKREGGAPLEKGAALCVFLASRASDGITGKIISAVWDPWPNLASRVAELKASDIYTLRRIVPGDRGKDWTS